MQKKAVLFLFCLVQSFAGMYAHTPFDVPEEEVRVMCIEMITGRVRHSDAFRNTYHPHYRIIRQ